MVTICDEAHLRTALTNDGIITFACNGTIILSKTITVRRSATLDAVGHIVRVSGNNTVRLFNVNTGVVFSLVGVTLADGRHLGTNSPFATDGEPAFGGAICNDGGRLDLIDCVFTNHGAFGGHGGINGTCNTPAGKGGNGCGGAVFNCSGELNNTNTLFHSNRATGGGGGGQCIYAAPAPNGGDAIGGAIYNERGNVNLVNCIFVSNSVTSGDAGHLDFSDFANVGNALGGAIHSLGGTVFASNAIFQANSCSCPAIPGHGQAGSACGGAVNLAEGMARFSRTSFATNQTRGGDVPGHGGGGLAQGGAIHNTGLLELIEDQFYGNRATGGMRADLGGFSCGGAVYSTNVISVVGSIFAGNMAQGGEGGAFGFTSAPGGTAYGGALYCFGNARITNSTFVANRAFGGKGGMVRGFSSAVGGQAHGGGIYNTLGPLLLVHDTFASNTVVGGLEGSGSRRSIAYGGGFQSTNGTVTLQNSIVAYSPSGNNWWADFAPLIDEGNNISSDSSSGVSAPGSRYNTDPRLGPLADYGGPTPTMALLAGSPAINKGLGVNCSSMDQREVARPFGPACDIGAFESAPPYTIRGIVSGYQPPGGLTISAGNASSVTKPDGSYILFGLTAGQYTLEPNSTDTLTVPASQQVMVGPDAVNKNFKAYRRDALTVESYTNRVLHLVYAGTYGITYQVQSSTNLSDWEIVSLETAGGADTFELFHTNSLTDSARYFQVFLP